MRVTRRLTAAAFFLTAVSSLATAQEGPLGLGMSREGSGTSWLPDASPMFAAHSVVGSWQIMKHGVAFLQYDKQGGPRGADQFGIPNWGMLGASRNAGDGTLTLRGMVSLDPFTIGAGGYPLLLQTGESYKGKPLIDKQHPHELFMELAARYERPISEKAAVSLYAGPVGEPAFGPVAFPHRPSAANDPLAPLSHHWQDATHIVFGVLTGGVFTRTVKLEASVFNGREPDETRTNFDFGGRSLDSYSGRLTWNPLPEWSLSGSFAYLKSPEGLHPDRSLNKSSLSALYSRPVHEGSLSLAAVYGANQESGEEASPSFLVEGNLDFMKRHSVFGRAEWVRKEPADLVLPASAGTDQVSVSALVAGYAYDLNQSGPLRWGVGVRGSINFIPSRLEATYGSATPTGFAVYLRVRAAPMSMSPHAMHNMPMGSSADRGGS